MSPDSIFISVFTPAQTEQIKELILSIQVDEFCIPITLEQQPDLSDIQKFYQTGKGNFWTAVSDGRVVGTIALLDMPGSQLALRKMFVAPEFRGAALGTASMLLDTALNWSRKMGIRKIFLGTTSKYKAAHRFYEKNGFTAIQKHELPQSFPLVEVDDVFYMLNL